MIGNGSRKPIGSDSRKPIGNDSIGNDFQRLIGYDANSVHNQGKLSDESNPQIIEEPTQAYNHNKPINERFTLNFRQILEDYGIDARSHDDLRPILEKAADNLKSLKLKKKIIFFFFKKINK